MMGFYAHAHAGDGDGADGGGRRRPRGLYHEDGVAPRRLTSAELDVIESWASGGGSLAVSLAGEARDDDADADAYADYDGNGPDDDDDVYRPPWWLSTEQQELLDQQIEELERLYGPFRP